MSSPPSRSWLVFLLAALSGAGRDLEEMITGFSECLLACLCSQIQPGDGNAHWLVCARRYNPELRLKALPVLAFLSLSCVDTAIFINWTWGWVGGGVLARLPSKK